MTERVRKPEEGRSRNASPLGDMGKENANFYRIDSYKGLQNILKEIGEDVQTVTFTFNDNADRRTLRRHANGGGFVEDTAHVDKTAYVGRLALVLNTVEILDEVMILGEAIISERAQLRGMVSVMGESAVFGDARLLDNVRVWNSVVYENVTALGDTHIYLSRVFGNVLLRNANIWEKTINGNGVIEGNGEVRSLMRPVERTASAVEGASQKEVRAGGE